MESSRKFVSNHHSGRGVTFDCSDMAGESMEGWARGKFVSNHHVGRGMRLEGQEEVQSGSSPKLVTPLPQLQVVLTLNLQPDTNRMVVRSTLDAVGEFLNNVMTDAGGDLFRLENATSGEQPDGTYQYVLTTTATDDVKKLTIALAKILAEAAMTLAEQVGLRTVARLANENRTLCEIAA
jgi:hypothetical protein